MTDFTAADWPNPATAGTFPDDDATPAAPPRSERGWTSDAQASFLEMLSRGATVEVSAHHVGLARSSAYALRHAIPSSRKAGPPPNCWRATPSPRSSPRARSRAIPRSPNGRPIASSAPAAATTTGC